ncbi:hypothetical protein L596_026044 [Steinernema carpocapsae]|uniref:Uncharacterized protein n=1 Tax=Steinernema carpocapsae TaxID=34508 RepID=A0A4U5M069_STECR|nr:hypothetical protein L596_026044 [Steinernema carpocapsae]
MIRSYSLIVLIYLVSAAYLSYSRMKAGALTNFTKERVILWSLGARFGIDISFVLTYYMLGASKTLLALLSLRLLSKQPTVPCCALYGFKYRTLRREVMSLIWKPTAVDVKFLNFNAHLIMLAHLPFDIIYDFWNKEAEENSNPYIFQVQGIWKDLFVETYARKKLKTSLNNHKFKNVPDTRNVDSKNLFGSLHLEQMYRWANAKKRVEFFGNMPQYFTDITFEYASSAVAEVRCEPAASHLEDFLFHQLRSPQLRNLKLVLFQDLNLGPALTDFCVSENFQALEWEFPFSSALIADVYKNWMQRKLGPNQPRRKIKVLISNHEMLSLVFKLSLHKHSGPTKKNEMKTEYWKRDVSMSNPDYVVDIGILRDTFRTSRGIEVFLFLEKRNDKRFLERLFDNSKYEKCFTRCKASRKVHVCHNLEARLGLYLESSRSNGFIKPRNELKQPVPLVSLGGDCMK